MRVVDMRWKSSSSKERENGRDADVSEKFELD
jgi:hypothetical protein